MKEQVYEMSSKKIIGNSIAIWSTILMQVGGSIYFIFSPNHNLFMGLLFLNVMLSILSLPGLILFNRHYKYSQNKKIILTYEKTMVMDGENIFSEIINADVKEIECVSAQDYKVPWNNLEYFLLKDGKGNSILIPSLVMSLAELRVNTLSRKIKSSVPVIKTRKLYPPIPIK